MFDPVVKLKEFIACPSVSADPEKRGGMADAQRFLAGLLCGLGFDVEVVATGLHPIVLAERRGPDSWPHVMIYGHYDVQPADPLDLWQHAPFEAVMNGSRLYGRGASDNKGPLMANIAAIGQLLEEDPALPLRVTFLIEGEEEIGSPSFDSFLRKHRTRLSQADFVFLSDTGLEPGNQAIVTCGLRGLMGLELHVTGPKQDLHSGLHGGAVRNPIQALAEICASLHTPEGWVNVPGFYGGLITAEPWEQAELKKLKLDEAEYARFLGIDAFMTPPSFSPFEAVRFMPTLEFNGITGGFQGVGPKTIIPSHASVKITCRLVPNQDPGKIQQLVMKAIRTRIPKGVQIELKPQQLGDPYVVVPPGRPNTPADQPAVLKRAFRAIDSAATETWGKPPLYLREGGSIPIIPAIKRRLGLDSIMFGLSLPEDGLHAPNESFDLNVMRDGTKIISGALREVAAAPRS